MAEQIVRYPDRRGGPMRRLGKVVQFKDGRWVSSPIRVYVGPRKALRCL